MLADTPSRTLPEGWREERLGDVAEINSESLGSETPATFQFRYIDIASVTTGVIDWNSVRTHWFATAPSRARRVVRPGDVLLCTVRPGLQAHTYAGWRDFDGYICSTGFAVVRAGKNADPRFLYHVVFSKAIADQIRSREIGSNYPAIGESDVKHLRVLVPPIQKQRRIAEILDTADEAIQKTEALIAKLKQVKAGLMNDLLTCGIDENGQLRDPFVHPEQFKDSLLGRIPREWEITTLGDVVLQGGGFIQTGPFGSQLHAHEYVGEGVPVMMPQDMQDGEIIDEHIACVTEEKAQSLARHRVVVGDVLFARRGDLERCAAIHGREVGWLCGTGCLLIRPPKRTLSSRWLAATYRHEASQRQILARAVGTTMVNLNTSLLATLILAKPHIVEQQRIADILDAQDERIRAEEAYRDKLKLQKKGLIEDLLTGRVRVPADRDGEASR